MLIRYPEHGPAMSSDLVEQIQNLPSPLADKITSADKNSMDLVLMH